MIIGSCELKKVTDRQMIKEGLELKAYLCPAKVWTVGYGHTGPEVVEGYEITKEKALSLLENDLSKVEEELNRKIAIYKTLPDVRKGVLLEMAFNLGMPRLQKFRRMFLAIVKKDNIGVYAEILDSEAARQLPVRYKELANLWLKGVA